MIKHISPLALIVVGCSTLSPAQQAQRQECLAKVELGWHLEAERLCPPDAVYWDDCEHAELLESQLADRQRACSEGAHR